MRDNHLQILCFAIQFLEIILDRSLFLYVSFVWNQAKVFFSNQRIQF